jgi:hypothetical protein
MNKLTLSLTIIFTLSLSVISYAADSVDFPLNPNIETSPGSQCSADDIDFRYLRYQQEIFYCKRNVDRDLKHEIYEMYLIPKAERQHYIIDHIIPLSIGGSNAVENLWPEHHSVKKARGTLEFDLFKAVRDNRMTQVDAINEILSSKFE